jgi:hypothetical protein
MAGLFIKELIIRGDLERCLIIAPGSLVAQRQDELKESSILHSISSRVTCAWVTRRQTWRLAWPRD